MRHSFPTWTQLVEGTTLEHGATIRVLKPVIHSLSVGSFYTLKSALPYAGVPTFQLYDQRKVAVTRLKADTLQRYIDEGSITIASTPDSIRSRNNAETNNGNGWYVMGDHTSAGWAFTKREAMKIINDAMAKGIRYRLEPADDIEQRALGKAGAVEEMTEEGLSPEERAQRDKLVTIMSKKDKKALIQQHGENWKSALYGIATQKIIDRRNETAETEDGKDVNTDDVEQSEITEREMTPTEISRRDQEVRRMKSKESEYKQKFGSKATDMMYADATRKVMTPDEAKSTLESIYEEMELVTLVESLREVAHEESSESDSTKTGVEEPEEPAEVTTAVVPLRFQAATLIASTLTGSRMSGVEFAGDTIRKNGTPEQLVNNALRQFLRNSHSQETWQNVGNMLTLARQMDINWDDTILRPDHRKLLGL